MRNGKAIVEVPATVQEIKLPRNVADQVSGSILEIKAGTVTVDIPSDVLIQLTSMATQLKLKDSSISLKLAPLSEPDANKLISKGTATNETFKLAGDGYEFTLLLTTGDGRTKFYPSSPNQSRFN